MVWHIECRGVMPTPPPMRTYPMACSRSMVKTPWGPSSHIVSPGFSAGTCLPDQSPRFRMVKATVPPGSTSPADDMEIGCWPTPKGVRPAFSHENWPGLKLKPSWPTGLRTSVRELPASTRFSTTSHFLFQLRMGVMNLNHKNNPRTRAAYRIQITLRATVDV